MFHLREGLAITSETQHCRQRLWSLLLSDAEYSLSMSEGSSLLFCPVAVDENNTMYFCLQSCITLVTMLSMCETLEQQYYKSVEFCFSGTLSLFLWMKSYSRGKWNSPDGKVCYYLFDTTSVSWILAVCDTLQYNTVLSLWDTCFYGWNLNCIVKLDLRDNKSIIL